MGKVVVLKNVRIALFKDPALWQAKQYEGKGAFRYSAKFIMAPDSEARKVCDQAIKEVAAAEWKSKTETMTEEFKLNRQKWCFEDGNRRPEYAGYPGNWVLTANRAENAGPPMVVNRNPKQAVLENSGIIFSGCIVNAKVEFYAQSGVNAGMRCTLITVQYVENAEAFGGAAPASADDLDDLSFEDDDEGDIDSI